MDSRKLLPDEARSPWLLMAIHAVPQVVLGLILWRAWDLVCGEVDAIGRGAYLRILAMQVGIVAVAAGASVALLRRSQLVRWPVGLAFMVLNIAFLWAGLALCDDLVPRTVADWMLSPTQLAFVFVCLVAPALFYNALCVAGLSLSIPRAVDIGGSVAALVLIPVGWYLCVVLGHRFLAGLDIPYAVGIAIFVVCTAVVAFVFLRLLMWLYRVARGTVVPALVGGLVLPFGGLALNIAIPFPVNLQYWPVYVLTAINGIVLLLPFKADQPMRQWVWFARIVMYPFSLYFFLLFLPFLPLSIIAMIAAGAGFLILAPTFLFVIHSRMIFDETRMLGRGLSRARILSLFVLALALLPAGYIARAAVHRTALMRAVQAVYAPDLGIARPAISPGITKVALERLQGMKVGLYLPFLSEIYNRIVFNGMVLPDYKVKVISEAICGEDLSRGSDRRRGWLGGDFTGMFFSSRDRSRSWANIRKTPRDVALKDVRITSLTTNGPLVEARIELDLQNANQPMAEFVGMVEMPPSVSVSGFELDMKGEWVAGRVFDRKSALWVYHMIRDTTRLDPGTLVYVDPRHLKLSVFPFGESEVRHCAIRLMFLAGDSAEIVIAGRRLELEIQGGVAAPIVQAPLRGGGTALYVPQAQAVRLPAVQRPACVHFLLDMSGHALEALPVYSGRIQSFLQRYPWATNTAATGVNFGSEPICAAGTRPDALLKEVDRVTMRREVRGGYCPDTAIRRILFKELTSPAPSSHATLFVLIAVSNTVSVGGLDEALAMVPDARVVNDNQDATVLGTPVVQFNSGSSWTLLASDSGGWVFNSNVDDAAFTVQGGSEILAVTPGVRVSADSRLAAAAAICKLSSTRVQYPAMADGLRAEMLSTAKQSGILASETAYIVLENSAQWRTLERAEKQSLAASGALEFDEFKSPEPEVWIILAGFAFWFAARRFVAKIRPRGIGVGK